MANTGKRPDYWEAKIQLRPFDEEAYDWILKQIMKRGNITIAKTENVRGGVDIYISDQKFARTLGSRFKKTFKGSKVVFSRSLFGVSRDKGKTIYRGTVLVRLPEEH